MSRSPRIALISATPVAIKPAAAAIATELPSATIWNLLDDRLLADAQEVGGVNDELWQRMENLIRYAIDGGADGVVLTCSQFGEVAQSAAAAEGSVPILAADDAAFDAVASGGFRRVLVLASLESALSDTVDRLTKRLGELAVDAQLIGTVVAGAGDAAARGAADDLAALLGDAAGAASDADAVLLAQYSLAIALPALSGRLNVPVIAGPTLAAQRLAEELGRR